MKDRSVLKVVHLSNNNTTNKNQVALKPSETDDGSMYVPFTSRPGLASEITYQRLSRLGRLPSTTSVPSTASRNGSIEEKSSPSCTSDNSQTSSNHSSSRSLSEPRRRSIHQTPANSNLTG